MLKMSVGVDDRPSERPFIGGCARNSAVLLRTTYTITVKTPISKGQWLQAGLIHGGAFRSKI